MKARFALFLIVLGLAAASCSSYQTCATYAQQQPAPAPAAPAQSM